MEVGSFIGAAAITEGEVRIRNANPNKLGMIDQVYRRLGVKWVVDGEDIVVPDDQSLEVMQHWEDEYLKSKRIPGLVSHRI